MFTCLLIAALCASGNNIYGQNAAPAPAPSPTIFTNADEVSLDLTVRDKKNKPVLDLKPGDIAVSDSGTPVKISDFRLVTGNSAGEHLVTLVFDRLEPSAAKNARDIAGKILKMSAASNLSYSVLKIQGRLQLFHAFTSDRNEVTRAIGIACDNTKNAPVNDSALAEKNLISVAQTGADSAGAVASTQQRSEAQMMLSSLEESQRIIQDQHATNSLGGLLALARTQRRISGRKIVIYFSEGLQIDSNSWDMVRSIVGAANQSGVIIYAVDTSALDNRDGQGLMATVAMGNVMSKNALNPAPTGPNAPNGAYGPGEVTQASDQFSRVANEGLSGYSNPLAQMAIGTGGAYIVASDNIKKPITLMIEDLNTYYQASYSPSIQQYDGRFRPVTITPLRAGLKIRSTTGYFALPPGSSTGIRPFEAPLLKILAEPQLPSDLKFRAAIFRMGDLPDGNANSLVVEVPLDELDIHKDINNHLFSVHLSIVAQIKNKAGDVVEHFSEDIPRHGALETLDEARSEVVTLQRHFSASPGEYQLEAVILDRNNEKAGAQRINFEISKSPGGPLLSDLALVRRTDPFKAETDPLEPLRYENGRIVPDLSGNISNKGNNISLFFVIHPDAQATEPARLEMEVLRNGDPIANMPLPLRKNSGHGAVPYMASIQAGALPAGRYEVTAKLTQGDKTSASTASFTVQGVALASVTMATGSIGTAATSSKPDIEMVPDSKLDKAAIDSHPIGRLTITSITDPLPPPTPDQVGAIVGDARVHALSYSVSLPNFTCVEMTDRSVDSSGNGRWRHKDTFAELLRYVDNAETRTMLRVNGQHTDAQRSDLNGPLSQGEFGGVLKAVFSPSSKADFQYKETDSLGTGTVQVLKYHVAQANSMFSLSDSNRQMNVGFHGLVYVDSTTRSVRRITLEAEGVPKNFALQSTAITVDYDYVAIGAHDYLVPIRASVSLTQGKREAILNEIEFRNYRRYAAQAKIIYGNQVPGQK
jgi:VWFA-related protein